MLWLEIRQKNISNGLSLDNFDILRVRYSKVGHWSKGSPIPDFSKGKVVFSPISFLNPCNGLIGVKKSLGKITKSIFILRAWEKGKKKKKKKGEREKFRQERP